MIYLCSVYSYRPFDVTDEQYSALMDARADYAAQRCAEFMMSEDDKSIFCPIAHCHRMARDNNLPRDWEFWKEVDTGFVLKSDAVYVLKMPYWERSVGINAEIDIAIQNGIPVKFIECDGYEEIPF